MWDKLRKLLIRLISILSIVIILFSVMILLKVITTKQGQVPDFMGYSLLRVVTGSMEPTLPVDSLIVIKKCAPEELKEGQIISFYSNDPSLFGEINTHRIVEISKNEQGYIFYTKGDANYIADKHETTEKELVGRVIFSSVFLGKLVRLLSNPLIFFPVVILPLGIFIIKNIYDGIKAAAQLAKEEEEAAVREAIRELRRQKEEEHHNADIGQNPEDNQILQNNQDNHNTESNKE